MQHRLETALTSALLLCAIGVSVSYAYNTFFRGSGGADLAVSSVPFEDWDEALNAGHTVSGDSSATTTIVLFADFQCPACRGYHERVVKPAISRHGSSLRVFYVPFPLDYHEHALPAARATECVARAAKLDRWLDRLYAQQDSLGRKPWSQFAHDAGVVDTAAITSCLNASAEFPRIAEGLRLARKNGLQGTPSLVMNGRLYRDLPTAALLDSVIERHAQRSR
ncbi:MAG: DsbA family protein [Gemmatimonadaceae bacterium]|jgi:protein-disulfide isomerase|nr:DsbA family protein [Gemmatimonadaceae bacterium]